MHNKNHQQKKQGEGLGKRFPRFKSHAYSPDHIAKLLGSLALFLLLGCNGGEKAQPQQRADKRPPTAPQISLSNAAGSGNLDAVKQHIAAGTDINKKQPGTGNTPLNNACLMGHTETAKALIEAGAAIELKNNEQNTPLFSAAFLCHTDTVKLLLKHNANALTTDKNGTPLVDVMSAPWKAVAGIYDVVYSLIGVGYDAEAKKKTRPLILKLLKEHIAK